MKQNINILGSTGSIGETTLKIINKEKNKFKINILVSDKNYKKIKFQIKKFKPKIFIQVNIGEEDQKNGIALNELDSFYESVKNFDLDIIGLMCIPPFVDDTEVYFEKMVQLKNKINLNDLSMGMSNDYLKAAKNSSTYVRIGSKIFGERG